jgi:autotransporter adhesin
MNFNKIALVLSLVVCLMAVNSNFYTAQAAIVITGTETDGNVVLSYTGSINLTGIENQGRGEDIRNLINPTYGDFAFGSASNEAIYFFPTATGASSYGTGSTTFASASSGDRFLFYALYDNVSQIIVDSTYISGTNISGSLTFNGATFSSLGITPGTYKWTLSNNDTITLNASIPES